MKKSETFVDELANILVQNRTIKEDEAIAMKKAFFDRSQESFDQFLIEEGLVPRSDLLNALSMYYNLPAFDVVGHFFDHALLHKFPKGFLLRNEVVPLQVDENMLIVVAGHPNDPDLAEKLNEYVSYEIRFMVGITRDITDAIKEFYDLAPTETAPADQALEKTRIREMQAEEMVVSDEDLE